MKEPSFITNNGPSKSYIIIHLSPPNSSKQQRRQTKEPRWFGILQTISSQMIKQFVFEGIDGWTNLFIFVAY